MPGQSPLALLLKRARCRLLIHVVLQKAALVSALGLAACVLVLSAGTDIIDWYWPVGVVVVSTCIVLLRSRPGPVNDYVLAQLLDRRLGLHDALSTALWFENDAARACWTPAMVRKQREFANTAAGTADLGCAIPFKASRSLYCAGALALVGAGLFVARYGTMAHLDLARPLIPGAMKNLVAAVFERRPSDSPTPDRPLNREGAEARLNAKSNSLPASKPAAAPGRASEGAGAEGKETAETAKAVSKIDVDESGSSDAEVAGRAESGQSSQESGGDGAQSPAADSMETGDGQSKAGETGGQQNGSLLDRMRDAMAGLMSKLGMQPNSGRGASQDRTADPRQNNNSSARPGSPQAAASNQPGRTQDGAANQDGRNGMSPQPGGGTEQARGSGSEARGERSGTHDGNSGIGRQDGNKDTKLADQLAAMGKLSEILGKRSRNLTGEVMVEVTSSSQRLTTPYSGRRSAHADAGGEISRDQIPREYQQYVVQYFEQVHKLAGKRAADAKP